MKNYIYVNYLFRAKQEFVEWKDNLDGKVNHKNGTTEYTDRRQLLWQIRILLEEKKMSEAKKGRRKSEMTNRGY